MATETVNVDATAIRALITAEETAREAADIVIIDALDIEIEQRLQGDSDTLVAASLDATTKANNAQSAAIAAAATDATTKANAAQSFAIQRANHTGTQSADTLTDGTTNKAFLATERTKLSGIATGATANSSDATLLARANHTGTQLAATISDFNAAALAAAPAETTTTAGALINGATAKTTPVDADFVGLMDSAASNVLKKLSWLNIKATLKTYFDTLYASLSAASFLTYTGGSVATTSTSLANVHASTGLTIPSAGFYEFQYLITYQSAATTTGARFSINSAAANSYLAGGIMYSTLPGDRGASPLRDYDAGFSAPSTAAPATDLPAIITGNAYFTGAGTLVLRFATSVSGSAITVNALTGFIRKKG